MKKVLAVFLLFFSLLGYSQKENQNSAVKDSLSENTKEPVQDSIVDRPQAVSLSLWARKGKFNLLANQTAFNDDWIGGGQSNLAVNSNFEYTINYKKGQWSWDNKLLLAYGITKIKDLGRIRKVSDNIEISSVAGRLTGSGFWSYSGYFNFKTQFAKGYNFKKDDSRELISRGFSPAYFQLGPGLLYKKSENFNINFAPATIRLIVVDEFFTREKANFGVEQGDTQNIEFGASIAANHKFILFKNVTLENILNLYSNYLEKVTNVDINYTFNMESTINEHMSANFTFQAIYDEDAVQHVQVRQLIALGVLYEL